MLRKRAIHEAREPPPRSWPTPNFDLFDSLNARLFPLHCLAESILVQAIDVLERTLDDGFGTSFEPKEYIRIYT